MVSPRQPSKTQSWLWRNFRWKMHKRPSIREINKDFIDKKLFLVVVFVVAEILFGQLNDGLGSGFT